MLDDDTANESGNDLNYSHDDSTPLPKDLLPADENPTPLSHQMNEHEQYIQIQSFTEQNVLLFQRRFEEDYDLYDPLYQKWLEQDHPEAATSYNSENSQSILNLFPEAQ